MADTKPVTASKPEPQAKPDPAKAEAHSHKIDRLKRAIAPLEQAAANAHDQAGAGHVIAPTVTETVVKAAHEMLLAAKAVVSDA